MDCKYERFELNQPFFKEPLLPLTVTLSSVLFTGTHFSVSRTLPGLDCSSEKYLLQLFGHVQDAKFRGFVFKNN